MSCRLANSVRKRGLNIGGLVAPVWSPTGGGSAMGDDDDRGRFLTQVTKACRIAKKLRGMGVRFLTGSKADPRGYDAVGNGDVVIVPAFGMTVDAMDHMTRAGATLVDTTCGSVLVVWKRVQGYAKNGFTALIHGKYLHEESRATASQVRMHPDGAYIIVRDMAEAELVCAYAADRDGHLTREAFLEHFVESIG